MTNIPVAFFGAQFGVGRLDAAVGSTSTSFSYTISSGADRCVCVAVCSEGTDPVAIPTASWGGQSMTRIINPDVGSPDANRVTLFWMGETKIALGSGTTLSVSGTTGDVGVSIASYYNCSQSVPSNTDVAENNGASPIQLDVVTSGDGSLVFAAAAAGTSATTTWGADMIEQTDINPTGMGASMADALVSDSGNNVDGNPTFSSQNRAVGAAFEVEAA